MDKRYKQLKVTLTRSPIGLPRKMRAHFQSLGLKRTNQVRMHKDNDAIRGLINKIIQFVRVEGID